MGGERVEIQSLDLFKLARLFEAECEGSGALSQESRLKLLVSPYSLLLELLIAMTCSKRRGTQRC